MKSEKPLGHKSYGSIAHLPGSRLDRRDKGFITGGQLKICIEKTRDKHDWIVVQEKLDGTNVGVAKVEGKIVPINRAGYKAIEAPRPQHRMFAEWVFNYYSEFDELLNEGERVCGEWLAVAHGTLYDLTNKSPFVIFDLMTKGFQRVIFEKLRAKINDSSLYDIVGLPPLLHEGDSCSIEHALKALGTYGHYGAKDPAEGCVWRVERKETKTGDFVDFLAKFVRKDKIDGKYFPGTRDNNSGQDVWNWKP